MRKTVPTVVTGVMLFAVLAGGTAWAQYGEEPSAEPLGTVSVRGGAPGEDLVLTGEDFLPGSEVLGVVIGPDGNIVASVTAIVAEDGTFELAIPIPADAPDGAYTVRVTGTAADGSPRTISQEVIVGDPTGGVRDVVGGTPDGTFGGPLEAAPGGVPGGAPAGPGDGTVAGTPADAPSGTSGGILARTGLQIGVGLALALGLLAVGTVAVRASRRRRAA